MRWARTRIGTAGLFGLGLLVMLGAAPATPSYQQVLSRIDQAKEQLSDEQQSPEKIENWNTFFSAVVEVLNAQAGAESATERREHLERLGRMRDALTAKNWGPSNRIAESLNEWLDPRLSVARSLESLEQAVSELPGSVLDNPDGQENAETENGAEEPQTQDPESVLKTNWSTYVTRLNAAIRAYETAESVSERLNAARKLRGGLDSLRGTQANSPWAPASELAGALQAMLDKPNVQIVADPNILSPFLNQQIVFPEVIYFRGQTSYVQPGPRTGFGLMHSNDGIAFYNSQWSYSTTPVTDFQQQVASNPQGRQATNMYQFGATIYNSNHATATAILTPEGLVVYPENAPNVSAAFGLTPQPGLGPGFMRFVASMIGFNQGRILSELQQQAMPQIQAETIDGTRELAAIKSAQEVGQQNQMIRQYLVGNRTLRFEDFAVTQLNLSSAPWAAYVSGVLQWAAEAGPQIGADFPKPPEFVQPESGLTVDMHLNSTLTNLAAGFYQTDQVKDVETLLIKVIPPEGDAPIDEGIEMIPNGSYQDLLDAVADIREQTDDPNAIALRITKPEEPPAFAVDAQGRLVTFVRGVTIEVPAPENFGQQGGLFGFGGNPRVLRFILEEVELTVDADITPENGGKAVRVQGEIASVTYGGTGTTVVTVGDEEDQTQTLNLLNRSGALGVLAGRLQGQNVDAPVPLDALQGFQIADVSDLHPTGWMRVVVQRDPTEPVPTPAALTASSPAPEAPAVPQVATQPTPAAPQPTLVPTGYVAQ
ncbi:hypothetical protein [Tautonia marina]|uniref:hypothetical protein n=1 Tax=Tautonia marina TaxID=2653855 RepID=UPI0012608FE2|nr:hypothetical protein [Tautonia marina]